jgi:uncharacterized membrane protein YdjX (TVP38/TMEM64 family)
MFGSGWFGNVATVFAAIAAAVAAFAAANRKASSIAASFLSSRVNYRMCNPKNAKHDLLRIGIF